jgi:hypothetical protein
VHTVTHKILYFKKNKDSLPLLKLDSGIYFEAFEAQYLANVVFKL